MNSLIWSPLDFRGVWVPGLWKDIPNLARSQGERSASFFGTLLSMVDGRGRAVCYGRVAFPLKQKTSIEVNSPN